MSSSEPTPIRIGTRASALARTQTGWVADRLREQGVAVRIETISTRGDERADIPIARLGGDGLFVRELEQALLDDRIDAAVHSLKDMPTAETPGLILASVPVRATPFDALVGRTSPTLAGLPSGAVVGTSSIRRVVQLRAIRPDIEPRPIRGNVDTRLRRLDDGEYDALILAAAGLERLGLQGRITELLRPPAFWPAVAQGALGIQARAGDDRTRRAVAAIDDRPTHLAVRAERGFLAELAGGCLAPIGAWGRVEQDGRFVLGGCVLEESGGIVRRLTAEEAVAGADVIAELSTATAAEVVGARAAARLLADGAADMLARMRDKSL